MKKYVSLILSMILVIMLCACNNSSKPETTPDSSTPTTAIPPPSTNPDIDWSSVPETDVDLSPFEGGAIDTVELNDSYSFYIQQIQRLDNVPTLSKVNSDITKELYEINDNFLHYALFKNENPDDPYTEIFFVYKMAKSNIQDVLNKRVETLKTQYSTNQPMLIILDNAQYSEFYNNCIFVISEHSDVINQFFCHYWDPFNYDDPLTGAPAVTPSQSIPEFTNLTNVWGTVTDISEDYFIINFVNRHEVTIYPDEEILEPFPELKIGDYVNVYLSESFFLDTSLESFEVTAFYIEKEELN